MIISTTSIFISINQNSSNGNTKACGPCQRNGVNAKGMETIKKAWRLHQMYVDYAKGMETMGKVW